MFVQKPKKTVLSIKHLLTSLMLKQTHSSVHSTSLRQTKLYSLLLDQCLIIVVYYENSMKAMSYTTDYMYFQ